ncbi:MAG TPA: rhodanese-like domain-containing protein [Sulfurovum sp.]|nr:rhodanese-like domain-containing protein [Sulfurovum sp.]
MQNQILHYQNKLKYEIDSWDVSVSIESSEDVVIIDTRSPEVYHKEHIPTALNIPYKTMSKEHTKHLNKNTLYVTYCDGIGCNASTKGALAMTKLGFQTKELLGGLDWWKRDGHKTEGTEGTEGTNTSCGC